jgi:Ni,Fe-hydrogenase III small subunit
MMTPRDSRRGAVAVLPVAAGGCLACAQSVDALQATRYAATLREQGISFTRSPRHADIVLISGTVTTASLDTLRRYLDAVPQPRALIAVGDCAIDGGVFAGAQGLVDSPAEALDVNVEIAGCPPSPTAILTAIGEAAQLLAHAVADEAAAAEAEADADREVEVEDASDELDAREVADLEEELVTSDETASDESAAGDEADASAEAANKGSAADQGQHANADTATETGTPEQRKGHSRGKGTGTTRRQLPRSES